MNQTIELLNCVWENGRSGLSAVRALLNSTDDARLRNELYDQETKYQNIIRDAENQLAANDARPNGNDAMTRACMWAGLKMNTMADKSTQNILGIIIQGNTMGIVETTKARSRLGDADQASSQLAGQLITFQQENIDSSLKMLEAAQAMSPA